jgi:hypothetical protein
MPRPAERRNMADSLRAEVAEAVRDAVPFLVIVVVWVAIMLALYGVFLVTKPSGVTYDPWVYASVLVVPGLGFVAHLFKQALKV